MVIIGVCLFELVFQCIYVGIGILIVFGFVQVYVINDGGMVQCVGNDCVFWFQQRFENVVIGVECGGVEDCIFVVGKFGDFGFELFVNVLGVIDEVY